MDMDMDMDSDIDIDIEQPPLTRNRSRSLSPPPRQARAEQQQLTVRSAQQHRRQRRRRGRLRIQRPSLQRQRSRSVSPASPHQGGNASGNATSRGGSKESGSILPAHHMPSLPPVDSSDGVERVRVICRVRPPNEEELQKGPGSCVEIPPDDPSVIQFCHEGSTSGHNFSFDHCFGQTSTNTQIFEQVGRPLVNSALNGINGAALCYGQTGAGKTFTMFGMTDMTDMAAPRKTTRSAAQSSPSTPSRTKAEQARSQFANRGLVDQTLAYLFSLRNTGLLTKTVKIDVCISCLEV